MTMQNLADVQRVRHLYKKKQKKNSKKKSRFLPNMRFSAKIQETYCASFKNVSREIVRLNFLKKLKNLKNSYKKILIKKTGIFSGNRALSVFFIYDPLTSCKELGKSLEPFLRSRADQLTNQLPRITNPDLNPSVEN